MLQEQNEIIKQSNLFFEMDSKKKYEIDLSGTNK